MKRRKWTADEFGQLFDVYPSFGVADLPYRLSRSEDSITAMARRFGLRSRNHRRHQAASRIQNRGFRVFPESDSSRVGIVQKSR